LKSVVVLLFSGVFVLLPPTFQKGTGVHGRITARTRLVEKGESGRREGEGVWVSQAIGEKDESLVRLFAASSPPMQYRELS
jgi:hypothetical protein